MLYMISVSGCIAGERSSQHKSRGMALPRLFLFCELCGVQLFHFVEYIILDFFIFVNDFRFILDMLLERSKTHSKTFYF